MLTKVKSGSKYPIWNTQKTFEIKTLQILDENGNLVNKMPRLTDSDIKKMYKLMVISRVLDDKMLSLQRQGRIGTFPQIRGQEASNIGVGCAMNKEDWLAPSFRETGTMIALGLPIENILLYYSGDERGSEIPEKINTFPICVPVSTQTLHAVGFAWSKKLQKKTIQKSTK